MEHSLPSSDFRILPRERKLGKELYLMQMWAWGQDIRHPSGNLLKRYGFHYQRNVPQGKHGSSCYTLNWSDGEKNYQLQLWSFGLLIGEAQHGRGNILLERHAFRPKWLEQTLKQPITRPQDLPCLRQAQNAQDRLQTRQFLVQLCQQIGRYESWLHNEVGPQWRDEVFERSPRKARLPIHELADNWQQLAQDLAHNSERLFAQ